MPSYLRRRTDPKDIFQDALLRAWESYLARPRPSTARLLEPWFKTVVLSSLHDAHDVFTAKKRAWDREEPRFFVTDSRDLEAGALLEPKSHFQAPDAFLLMQESFMEILRAIASVHGRRSVLIFFVKILQIPLAMAAKDLTMTPKAASQCLWLGLKEVREHLVRRGVVPRCGSGRLWTPEIA